MLGNVPLAPQLITKLARQVSATASEPPLTPRQLEILTYVGRGQTYKKVAQALSVSEDTVKYHMKQILAHLGVNNRTEAVAYAMQRGWIKLT